MHLPDSLSDERAHILLPDTSGVICKSRHSKYARRFRQYVDISLLSAAGYSLNVILC